LELKVEDAGIFILEPGDRDFMPKDTRHSARVIGDEPVVYLIGSKN
jgi:quercetin dioxygenase-like cupin family protein